MFVDVSKHDTRCPHDEWCPIDTRAKDDVLENQGLDSGMLLMEMNGGCWIMSLFQGSETIKR